MGNNETGLEVPNFTVLRQLEVQRLNVFCPHSLPNEVHGGRRHFGGQNLIDGFSEEFFTYRQDSGARVDVIPGDGRISLEREMRSGQLHRFDVLVLDAFSGDAPPIHLLTEESAELYWKHLKPDGILAVHITNRHVDLSPVVRGLAAAFRKQALQAQAPQKTASGIVYSNWMLVTSNQDFLRSEPVREVVQPPRMESAASILWTDNDHNLFGVLN